MKNIFIISILFLVLSCTNSEVNEDKTITIPIRNIERYKVLANSEVFDSIKFIKLETSKECLVGNIDILIPYKGKFYILDAHLSKSILIFNENGTYFGRVGKNGKGPGEYLEPKYIAINKFTDEILVYDNSISKISCFNLNGKYKNSFMLKNRIHSISVLSKNKFAVFFNYYGNENIDILPKHNIYIINKDGTVFYKFFDRKDSNIPASGWYNHFFSINNNTLFNPPYSNFLFALTERDILKKYKIDFGVNSLPENFFKNVDQYNLQNKLIKSDYATIKCFLETDNYLIFSIVYKETYYNCYYSKRTGILKYGNYFINDIYGLVTGDKIMTASQNDQVISYFEPSSINFYKNLLNNSINDKTFIKKEYKLMLENIHNKELSSKLNDVISNKVTFNPTINEINYINSITPNDNPVLIIYKLKSEPVSK